MSIVITENFSCSKKITENISSPPISFLLPRNYFFALVKKYRNVFFEFELENFGKHFFIQGHKWKLGGGG
jgi:hypothetical protein